MNLKQFIDQQITFFQQYFHEISLQCIYVPPEMEKLFKQNTTYLIRTSDYSNKYYFCFDNDTTLQFDYNTLKVISGSIEQEKWTTDDLYSYYKSKTSPKYVLVKPIHQEKARKGLIFKKDQKVTYLTLNKPAIVVDLDWGLDYRIHCDGYYYSVPQDTLSANVGKRYKTPRGKPTSTV